MRKVAKALWVTAILSVICCIFGCDRLPEYTVDDIRSISISCGHMDYSRSYSFYLRKDENRWLLDADFSRDTEQARVEYENCPVAEEDVKELLAMVQKQNVTEKLRRFKKPKIKVFVSDETSYYTSILFADGESFGAAALISQDMEAFFYRLAEKYAATASKDQ